MSARLPAKEQPAGFEFTPENLERAKQIIAKYPAGRQRSAVMPLLDLAQRQNNNWVSVPAMQKIAEMLDMAYIRVYEVASFYTMYNLAPVGKHLLQICRTTPCWLRGSDDVTHVCKSKLGIEMGETTADGKFTMMEVECLGACVNAPVIQVNDDFYEDLDAESTAKLLDDLASGRETHMGPQNKTRHNSAPEGGATTLKNTGEGK